MLKKSLSVILAVIMMLTACSVGFMGMAAEIDYNLQYSALAQALKNNHVRSLTNYKIVNSTLDNGAEGFSTEANGFAYEHRVTAADDVDGSILRAANIFYYVAENLISTQYGIGYYNPSLLLAHVTEKINPYFEDSTPSEYEKFDGTAYEPTKEELEVYQAAVAELAEAEKPLTEENLSKYALTYSDDGIVTRNIDFVRTFGKNFEDFYGNRYYPSEAEYAEYNNVVSLIEASNANVSERTLTEFRIYFIEKNNYEYYNIEAVLKYFLGNTTTINAGNWYHRYVFVVETSLDTAIQNIGNVHSYSTTVLVTRTGVYEWDYARSYNELGTKAYYSFAKPSAKTVWTNYGGEFGLDKVSADFTVKNDEEYLTPTGQASAFLLKEKDDTTTIPTLRMIYDSFRGMLQMKDSTDSDGKAIKVAWDTPYSSYSDAKIKSDPNNAVLTGYVANLGATYSNDALLAMFGEEIGNIVNAAYALTTTDKMPERTLYGTKITVTPQGLDEIVYDMDGLVSPREDTGNDRDALVAGKVATIIKQFFNTENSLFEGSAVYGLEFNDLHELVGLLVNGLVFRDSIVNMLMKLLYPLITDLIETKVVGAIGNSTIGGLVGNILESVLTNNDLAIYPNTLAKQLQEDCDAGEYSYDFSNALAVLKGAGGKWENVNWDALSWGIDEAPLDKKADMFLEALTAALSGFLLLLVTFLCGATKNDARTGGMGWTTSNQFTEYYSKLLINLGQNGVLMRSQGLYCKLLIPLYRALGLSEITSYRDGAKLNGYLTTQLYEGQVDKNGINCLKKALEPIIYWATDMLGQKPFETLWTTLPNLVNLFTRTTTVDLTEEWHSVTNDSYAHDNFEKVQSASLLEILYHVYIKLTLFGNINLYSTSVADILPANIRGWLTSINSLLNGVLKLKYNTGKVDHYDIACYYDDAGTIVLPDSVEYASEPEKYPYSELEYYTDPTGINMSLTQDEDHPVRVDNPVYETREYHLPQIPEAKLVSCGTPYKPTDWNTLTIDHPGEVLLVVLRFVFSALGYKYNNATDEAADDYIPYLIECFGLKIDMELFQGLNLKDIIYNIMLHPDEAIWAVLELFYSHEDGNYLKNEAYTYGLTAINYHNSTLLNTSINPDLTYGTKVRYSKYWTQEYATDVVSNADEFVKNILIMFGMTDFKDGIGAYLEKLLNEKVFTNDILNTLFNTVYQLLGGLRSTLGFDIDAILDAALDVSYSTATVSAALRNMLGYDTEASDAIYHAATWTELFTVGTKEVDGVEEPVIGNITLDWGLDDTTTKDSRAEKFCKTISALFSPVAFVFRYLLLDEDIDLLSLIKLPSYAGYQYAVIGLLEALSCPNILTYKQYAAKCDKSDPTNVNADSNTIYYLLQPILGLLNKVYAQPVDTLLTLLPNLLFVISIGGLNDILNNLVHFAYVLLDVLSPIIDVYSILDGLLANLEVLGVSINLSLPLDVDFNALASDLISALVGNAIQINGVSISLPYIDFHTLCCGTLSTFSSKELRSTVYLNAAGGGDMITALLRLVFDALLMDENEAAIAELVATAAEEGAVDNYDKETIVMLVDQLFGIMQTYDVPDMVMFAVYFLVNKLTPVSGTLADRLSASGLTVQTLFNSITDVNSFIALVNKLVTGGSHNTDGTTTEEESNTLSGFGSLIQRIKEFFQKIVMFFQNMFKR